uniref:Uncharacterized protein n=1 Tax=Quercus lobata TaxID=97700 RepID=A0A7N2L7J7_QUELO
MPQNAHRCRLMTSKSTLSPEESKSRILRGYCGDRSINRPIGFRIGSGLLGQWPIRGRIPVRGHHAPRQYAFEDDRHAGLQQNPSRRLLKEERKQMADYLFKAAGEGENGTSKPPLPPSGDFAIGQDQLALIVRDHNVSALQQYGGASVTLNYVFLN